MVRRRDTPGVHEDAAVMRIGVATLEELRTLVGWAVDEGWNPGPHDADAFHAADPEGFLVGRLDDEPVAGISFVRYDPTWAFLGLYIVRPAFRGRGHGIAMWRAAMARREGRSVGLDGVVERQADYARSGFALVRRNVRYEGTAPLDIAAGQRAAASSGIVPVASVPFDALARLDRGAFPTERPAFLRAWVGLPGHVGLVATDADADSDRLRRHPAGAHGLEGRAAVRPRRIHGRAAPRTRSRPTPATESASISTSRNRTRRRCGWRSVTG